MTSTNSSPKRIAKVSSDSAAIGFDLLSSLTYMSVLSIGNLPRDNVLEECGRQDSKTSVFFEYVHRLVKRLGMEYTRAFQLVSERETPENVKSLLLRFSASISSGESEKEFIIQETKAEFERYGNEYERSIENLRKWTDAYAAILISVTLIMVVSLVSSMMGSLAQSFVMIMAFAVFFITCVGIFIIYKSAPVEKVTYDRAEYSTRNRTLSRRFLMTLVPVGLVVALLVGPRFGLERGISIAFLSISVSLLPTGFLAWKDSGRVTKLDSELPTFLRTLGNVAGSTGYTITQALSKIDTQSMGSLKNYINPLNSRLSARLPVESC
jgi:flagellar protein FlaJ